ncbi:MAG: hypothetical protein U1C53_03390 [Candidatus Veblenbacteria bacterium]|nr:hypothetical protein [Candidatus Veblenbacteria bacterium]MDZ4230158.1 hypothetical protein [Candidatus Veblenbacteria bacterium]
MKNQNFDPANHGWIDWLIVGYQVLRSKTQAAKPLKVFWVCLFIGMAIRVCCYFLIAKKWFLIEPDGWPVPSDPGFWIACTMTFLTSVMVFIMTKPAEDTPTVNKFSTKDFAASLGTVTGLYYQYLLTALTVMIIPVLLVGIIMLIQSFRRYYSKLPQA